MQFLNFHQEKVHQEGNNWSGGLKEGWRLPGYLEVKSLMNLLWRPGKRMGRQKGVV